jgi:solute carrier family 25 (mitochondrial carnitine/acylcarnitine transporter), member 20/29
LCRLIRGKHQLQVFFFLLTGTAGPDSNAPKPLLAGIARIYRGLGVSALRSITTHGLLWTLFDTVANYIDNLPHLPEAG